MRGVRVEVRLSEGLGAEWEGYLRDVRRTAQAEISWLIRRQISDHYAAARLNRLRAGADEHGEGANGTVNAR